MRRLGKAWAEPSKWPLERPLRLSTGLVLLAFATTHFFNHAFGIRSFAAMEAAERILTAPWRSAVGLVVLYGAFVIHIALGLRALYRRRHLRMPASEAWQLGLGLTIPLLLIPHALGVRVSAFYSLDIDYKAVIHTLWILSPEFRGPRQLVLLLLVWLHACIGLRAWLRPKRFYQNAVPVLASVATLVPVLAIIGYINAGLELRDLLASNPALAARLAPPAPGSELARTIQARETVVEMVLYAYLGLIAAVFALRALRDWHARHFRAVRIAYPDARTVVVPAGFSVLEASRWAGIPHASVCGGRGRCTTCRVRVVAGMDELPPLTAAERPTLARIGNPPQVRLACQLRPTADLAVEPLVPVSSQLDALAARFQPAVEGGRELTVAAMFVDLRESTRLAAGRLPYDALFLVDRYIQTVTAAIRVNGGYVTSVAGDGVMSIFGIDADHAAAARCALSAALSVWQGLDELNAGLAQELEAPLRFGMGIHLGPAVVGSVNGFDQRPLQFLGDTGNVAAKLEAETKRLQATLVCSMTSLRPLGAATDMLETDAVPIAGRAEPLLAAVFRSREALAELLRSRAALARGV